ncbi:DNA polymerase zeta catalytic subunit [Iris pallida]|uniref:DNA polymerase zeta catalytic subunit n=1 Tax=Iris pallida TaxID=29817 RepID=A0AAX6IHR4_IRIPA|nr:DNA polymerase zeta catalytic subunit [Iris pallida]
MKILGFLQTLSPDQAHPRVPRSDLHLRGQHRQCPRLHPRRLLHSLRGSDPARLQPRSRVRRRHN